MPNIDVNDTTLAYDEVGDPDGIPLLLSHSLFFTRRMFDPLIEQLGAGYRVVAYDHRGQGESAPAPVEQLDMDTLSEDAAALIEALDLGPCHVVGNSMGGFIALRLAARRPDLVRSAVAVGSSAEEEHSLAAFAPLVAHMQANGTADVIDTLMHIMYGDTSLAEPSAQTLAWRTYMLGLDRSIGDAAHQVIHRRRLVEELDGCGVPVLAIAGAEDHAYPPPLSSDALAAASGGRSVVVTAAGHSVSLEQSAVVAEHLRAHLAELEAGVPA